MAPLVRSLRLRRTLGGGGAAVRHRPQSFELRAYRRHRGRADDIAAGAHRRAAQLGLPVLLDP